MLLHRLQTIYKQGKRIVLSVFFLLLFSFVKAQDVDSIAHNFELSFGQSTLFISNAYAQKLKALYNIVVPTNSMLFFVDFRPLKRLKVPVFFNLPTESKQYIVNGTLISEKAASTLGSGIEYNVIDFNIPYNSVVEINVAPMASFILRSNYQIAFAPLVSSRIRIVKDKNFIMYLGTSYSLGVNTWGLFYGTGYIF